MDDLASVLEAGPGHPRFCRAVLGSRGTGKTVLLDVIGELATNKLSWVVLHVQELQDESLVAVLLERVPEAFRPWGRLGRGTEDLRRPSAPVWTWASSRPARRPSGAGASAW